MTELIVTADDVCVALEDTLRLWLPPVLTAIERSRDLEAGYLRPPQSFEQLPDERQLMEAADQLPGLAISSSGLAARPQLDEEGNYRAAWTVNTFLAARGQTFRETQRVVRLYAAAIRAAVVQHPRLGGFAESTDWVGEDYARLGSDGARTLGACLVDFTVTVSAAVNAFAGPAAWPAPTPGNPSPAPPDLSAADPVVASTAVTVTPEA